MEIMLNHGWVVLEGNSMHDYKHSKGSVVVSLWMKYVLGSFPLISIEWGESECADCEKDEPAWRKRDKLYSLSWYACLKRWISKQDWERYKDHRIKVNVCMWLWMNELWTSTASEVLIVRPESRGDRSVTCIQRKVAQDLDF